MASGRRKWRSTKNIVGPTVPTDNRAPCADGGPGISMKDGAAWLVE